MDGNGAAELTSRDLAAGAYVDAAEAIDLQLSPLGLRAMGPQPGEVVVDIGCGAGQSVVQLAERVGPVGQVIGIDIAARVLSVARARTTGLPHARLISAPRSSLRAAQQITCRRRRPVDSGRPAR